MKTKAFINLFLLSVLITWMACKPVQERVILNGKWKVHRVNTNFVMVDNAMEVFLPGYISDHTCCSYIVDFKEDETVTGTYTKDHSVVQIDSGVWHLDKFNILYIKLGRYIDGTYVIDRHKNRKYTLTTNENKLIILPTQPPEITQVTINIERLRK